MRDVPDAAGSRAPILRDKHGDASSVFRPEHLLREARRQKGLPETSVPPLCVLDPDGDVARHLRAHGRARFDARWRVITPSFTSDPGKGVQGRLRHLASR
jgi:hypothetical protein